MARDCGERRLRDKNAQMLVLGGVTAWDRQLRAANHGRRRWACSFLLAPPGSCWPGASGPSAAYSTMHLFDRPPCLCHDPHDPQRVDRH